MQNSVENSGETKTKRKRPNAQAFALAIKDGATLQDALLAAGKTPAQAKKGNAAVNRELKTAYRELIGKDWDEMIALGKSVTPEAMRHAVVGGLVKGIAERSDKGAQILKLAGSWKDLNMWNQDSVAGVIVISTPTLPALDSVPMLDGSSGQLLTAPSTHLLATSQK